MSGKLVGASVAGSDRGTNKDQNKEDPNLVGEATETTVFIDNIETTALLDTGSCISSLGHTFYQKNFDHLPLKPISDILKVECADGQCLPYLGYIEASLTSPGIPQCTEQFSLFLIVPDTNYNLKVPVLIGTNILNELISDCKSQHGEQYLQTANLQTPWYLSMRCIAIRERELRKNKNRLAIIRSAENSKLSIGPNQSVSIKGYLDKELEYNPTCAIIQEAKDSSLPEYIDVTPGVMQYNYKKNKEVYVTLSNLTTNSVTISPKAILCEVQPVCVDESVFDRLENQTSKKIFDEIHIDSNLTPEQNEQVKSLLLQHVDVFSKDDSDIGDCDMIKHRIDLLDDTPFKQKHRRIPPSMIDEVRKHIEELLSNGIIKRSKSPWASNVVLVRKKNGKLRLCVDYRMLNKKTVKDSYALPRIEEVFDVLNGSTLFSTIDMKSGYHQVSVEESHKCRTAFTVGPLGFYEYNKMPFGLSNSPATYQRLMEECLGELNMKICVIYLDDLIIFSNSFEQHLERLDMVLSRLQQCNLKLSAEKCYFLQQRVKFLGHVVSKDGIETDPEKIEKIKNWPRPSNPDELRSFVAFAGYYRRFVKDFSKITKPLTDLLPPTTTKRNAKPKHTKQWKWEQEQEDTFNLLKDILTSPPILAYPEFQNPFELHTDASGKGLGAILYQTQNNEKKVIAYASRSLSKAEKNYSAFKLEFLALKWAVTEKFSDYLLNNQFTVYTDNNPLTHILTSAKLDATGQRWASALGQYNFNIIYRAALNNCDADSMSRYPFERIVTEAKDSSRIKIDDKTVKTICNNIHVDVFGYVETLPSAAINIVEATESQGQPLAQIEQREIRKSQREDVVLGKWVRATIDKTFPRNCNFTREDQIMRKTFNNLRMIRGILYREVRDGDSRIRQLVLPKVYHTTVLQGLHNDVGHPGRDRTISLIRERFYWPRMVTDIEKWTTECRRCLLRKSPTTNRAPLVNIVTTYPLELVCMDFLTLEPSKGCGNILVITDHFTKYALAIATKNQTARTTAEALYENFITHYGIPSRIHSDQGANFESEIIKELCKLTGMVKSRTTPYHAMGNPIPERYNRTLLNMLGTLEPDKKADWKKYLPSLTYAYNCTRHETTKISPYELMFGRTPRLPIDSLFDTPIQESVSQTTKDYIQDLKHRMKSAQEIVQKITGQARIKMKAGYDKKAKAARICVGDKVLVRILKYEGKHKIADKFEDTVYEVVRQQNEDIPVFDVRSPDGNTKKLHRNHLYLLSFMDNEAVIEEEESSKDGKERNTGEKNKETDDQKTEEKMEEEIDVKVRTTKVDQDKTTTNSSESGTTANKGNRENAKERYRHDSEDEDEDDDTVIEYVTHTFPHGDAQTTVPDHVERPVIPKDSPVPRAEKISDKSTLRSSGEVRVLKQIDSNGAHIDTTSRDTTDVERRQQLGQVDSSGGHTDTTSRDAAEQHVERGQRLNRDVLEPEISAQLREQERTPDTEGAVEDAERLQAQEVPLRRSTREKRPPKWLDTYQVNQITNRPVNRRLQTLQMLLNTGVFNQLDSDMTDDILNVVMKN